MDKRLREGERYLAALSRIGRCVERFPESPDPTRVAAAVLGLAKSLEYVRTRIGRNVFE